MDHIFYAQLLKSAQNGSVERLDALLEQKPAQLDWHHRNWMSPKGFYIGYSTVLETALENNHFLYARTYLNYWKPNKFRFWDAAAGGFWRCVSHYKTILDPKEQDSMALQLAVLHEHRLCIEQLYDVSDPHFVLCNLQHHFPDDYTMWGILERKIEAQRVQTLISSEINKGNITKTHRKM